MPTKRHQDLMDLSHPTDKKASKPLMEKRRRARINHSLAQLKALVVDPANTNTAGERSRQAKLEKADILELTVRHLYDIKRQQRTTALLPEDRHRKKKFEIGYSECAREVELFLSNLISLDSEVRQRLKDHLSRRLQDLRNIETREAASPQKESVEPRSAASPQKEAASDEDEEPSPSLPDSAERFSLLPTDTEDSSDSSSALNKMLKYYGGTPSESDSPSTVRDDFRPKRLKMRHSRPTEDDRDVPSSCHSVTSTTGWKSSDAVSMAAEPARGSDRNFRIKTHPAKKCLGHRPEALQLTNPLSSPRVISTKRTSDVPTSRQRQNTNESNHPGSISPSTLLEGEDIRQTQRHASDPTFQQRQNTNDSNRPGCISPSTLLEDEDRSIGRASDPIPLLPRQLSNGDWALVLPASLLPTSAKEVASHPFSAFRLVVPGHSETDADKQRPHSSSSSLLSDMSCDDFCPRSDGERVDHSSPDSSTHQAVWRPW